MAAGEASCARLSAGTAAKPANAMAAAITDMRNDWKAMCAPVVKVAALWAEARTMHYCGPAGIGANTDRSSAAKWLKVLLKRKRFT
ncbi:hypothetical protein GCM10010975_17100 [Comamonas phosphati]|nr:hypothetical protein GCM10010975_17100 [Comamonas phosphati]